jgi:hypothetical protein
MGNVGNASQPEHPRPKGHRFLGWFLAGVVPIAILLVYYLYSADPADPRCLTLLAHPDSEVVIPLPVNCILTTDAPADQMVKYLENERKQRGLVFKAWITCKSSNQIHATEFAFTHDPRWLPSYVPGTHQFRQTVIISGYAPPTPQESAVAGEVCLMPKRRYVSQIAGQCDGKFAVWK